MSRTHHPVVAAGVGTSVGPAEVDAITAVGRAEGRLFGGDPDTHEEM